MLRLFPPKQTTLFPGTPELKELGNKLEELFLQEKILKDDVANNPSHPISYIKSHVFSETIANIRQATKDYTQQSTPTNRKQKITNILRYVDILKQIIEISLNTHKEILNYPRNENKETAKNVINAFITFAVCFTGYLTHSFIIFLNAALASYNLNHEAQRFMKLDDSRATSVRLFEEVIMQLRDINCSMTFALQREMRAEGMVDLEREMPVPPADEPDYLLVRSYSSPDEGNPREPSAPVQWRP